MKKLIMALLIGSMVFGLTACGSAAATSETAEADTAAVSEPEEAGAETAEADTAAAETEEAAAEADSEAAETDAAAFTVGDKIKSIQEKGVLVVGCDASYAPYSFVDVTSGNTDPVGIDIEIAKILADRLGVELKLEPMIFNAVISALATDKLDVVIDGVTPSDEQRETVDFSKEYMTCAEGIVIKKEDADQFKSCEDFDGYTVAANIGSSEERFVKECLPGATPLSLDKIPSSMMELQAGNVAGVCMEKTVGQQYVDAYDNLTWSEASDDSFNSVKAIAVNKGNDDLLELVNTVIDECVDSGKIDEWLAVYSKQAAEMNKANAE